jgi:transcriptional repressor NrdR
VFTYTIFRGRLSQKGFPMKCPYCQQSETKVVDSRLLKEGLSVRRRRKCEACEKRFTTYETIEISMPNIVKLDGRREPYNREKIYSGIEKACQKRPISTDQLERIVENIEKSIVDVSAKEVKTQDIGNIVMMYLRNLDPVAYIRFASVYRKFQDVEEFVNDIKHDEESFSSTMRDA